jgi:ATP-binding cassette subfamily B protein
MALIVEDRSDLLALVLFSAVTGIVALTIPLAAQALVNSIAASLFLLPVLVLTGVVLVGLLVVGGLRYCQLLLVELLQQRIFARTAMRLAVRVLKLEKNAMDGEYMPEVVNRFFEVLTIQKSLAKLLIEGLGALLQTFVGLVLIAFYSPLLLGLDLALVISLILILFGLGFRGVETSIQESAQKYRVAEWLEELARCVTGFKMNASTRYLVDRADGAVLDYLRDRRLHFRVLARQAIGSYTLQALASAGTLGIGGWLVLNKEMTLGQLVAAELVIQAVLSAVDKLVQQTGQFYDLLTGLEKVGHILDLPNERQDGQPQPRSSNPSSVSCQDIHFSYAEGLPILKGVHLRIERGERVSIVGRSGSGKSTLISLICGLAEPDRGTVEIDGTDLRRRSLSSIRESIGLVTESLDIFDGTIEENIVVGRQDVSEDDLMRSLEICQLREHVSRLPQGLGTRLVSSGQNLSRGQAVRVLMARAIADRPSLLVLDEVFASIDEQTKLRIIDQLYSSEHSWTVCSVSHDEVVVRRAQRVYVMDDGMIVEAAAPAELAQDPSSAFSRLFPDLANELRRPVRNRRATKEATKS